jgi:hypothetical protein
VVDGSRGFVRREVDVVRWLYKVNSILIVYFKHLVIHFSNYSLL